MAVKLTLNKKSPIVNTHPFPLHLLRYRLRLKGLVYRVWSLVISHACLGHRVGLEEQHSSYHRYLLAMERGHLEWCEWDSSCGFKARDPSLSEQ